MLIQELEPRAEAMHAAQHQGMIGVIFRFCPHGPAPLQQLQCSFSAQQSSQGLNAMQRFMLPALYTEVKQRQVHRPTRLHCTMHA